MQRFKKFRGRFMMNFRRGSGIIIKRNAKILKGCFDIRMKTIDNILWGYPLFFSLNGNGHTMLITPTNKRHIVAL